MQLPKPLDFLYRLFVINTIGRIKNIDTLVEGAIVSAFGVLLCLGGWTTFMYAGLQVSAEISLLAMWAYLAVFVYHFVDYKREKRKTRKQVATRLINTFELTVSMFMMVVLYFLILDQAILAKIAVSGIQASAGAGGAFLVSIPGLVTLCLPLFAWEWLCRITPVDEIVRVVFR